LRILGPPGEGPRQALAVHGGLGAGRAEAQALGGRADPLDLFGQRQGMAVEVGEIGTAPGLGAHRLDHRRMGVADQARSPTEREIQVFLATGVPEATAGAMRHDHELVGRQPEFTVGDARRKYGERAFNICAHGHASPAWPVAPQ